MTTEPDRRTDWRGRFLADIPAAVALFDTEHRYLAASPAWAAAFGLPAAALIGSRHDELGLPAGEALTAALRLAEAGGKAPMPGAVGPHPAAQPAAPRFSARQHRDPDGTLVGMIAVLRHDLPAGTDPLHGFSDTLTGLAERREFISLLRQMMTEGQPPRGALTLFAINIDRFRNINNLHGVATGDQVLRVTAERLVAGTRAQWRGNDAARAERGRPDLVARLGGDEFGIICGPPPLSPAEATAFAERIRRTVQNPIALGEMTLRLTASIGSITTTAAHRSENDVLRDLDLAVRQAKALGPNRVSAWEPALTRAATRRYSLADELRRAFEEHEFVLHYQPVVRLADQRLVGAEALLRWRRASEGLLAPVAFIHVLEENGLICEVGAWALREAAHQIEAWHALYGREMIDWVSVNVSPRQFDDPRTLVATLRDLHNAGSAVRRLKLEITETTFMRNPETTRAVLAEIKGLGVRIGIDDFGTGYSSLNALRRYPVDTIKIDAEFTAQIGTANGEELTGALLNIARMYGAAIVAEGIETPAQRDFLRDRGCGYGQGYLFGEPMDAALLGNHALTMGNGPARRAG